MGKRKGKMPRKITCMGTSFTMPLKAQTFIPTGGVMRAISTQMQNITPNQTKSIPNTLNIGVRIGMVMRVMARESIMQPRNR